MWIFFVLCTHSEAKKVPGALIFGKLSLRTNFFNQEIYYDRTTSITGLAGDINHCVNRYGDFVYRFNASKQD